MHHCPKALEKAEIIYYVRATSLVHASKIEPNYTWALLSMQRACDGSQGLGSKVFVVPSAFGVSLSLVARSCLWTHQWPQVQPFWGGGFGISSFHKWLTNGFKRSWSQGPVSHWTWSPGRGLVPNLLSIDYKATPKRGNFIATCAVSESMIDYSSNKISNSNHRSLNIKKTNLAWREAAEAQNRDNELEGYAKRRIRIIHPTPKSRQARSEGQWRWSVHESLHQTQRKRSKQLFYKAFEGSSDQWIAIIII